MVQGVRQEEEEDDDYDQLAEGDGQASSSEQIDFVDIDEVAEDQEETEALRRAEEQRIQQDYYQKGLVFTHGVWCVWCVCGVGCVGCVVWDVWCVWCVGCVWCVRGV